MPDLIPRPTGQLTRIERRAARDIERVHAQAAVEVAAVRAEEAIGVAQVEAVASVGATAMAGAHALSTERDLYLASSPGDATGVQQICGTTQMAMAQVVQGLGRRLS